MIEQSSPYLMIDDFFESLEWQSRLYSLVATAQSVARFFWAGKSSSFVIDHEFFPCHPIPIITSRPKSRFLGYSYICRLFVRSRQVNCQTWGGWRARYVY